MAWPLFSRQWPTGVEGDAKMASLNIEAGTDDIGPPLAERL
jgi:hypothetical protein